jgi:hypothetical protein
MPPTPGDDSEPLLFEDPNIGMINREPQERQPGEFERILRARSNAVQLKAQVIEDAAENGEIGTPGPRILKIPETDFWKVVGFSLGVGIAAGFMFYKFVCQKTDASAACPRCLALEPPVPVEILGP